MASKSKPKRTRKPPSRLSFDHAMPYRRYQGLRDKRKIKEKNKRYNDKKSAAKQKPKRNKKK